MADALLRDLERRLESSPDDHTLLDRLEQEFARARRDLPWAALVRVERWRGLVDFAARFVAPLRPDDGVPSADLDRTETRLGFRLPKALREWYRLAGGRADILGGIQDYPIAHGDLRLRNRTLALYVENQGVFRWGVLEEELGLDDPPIVTCEDEYADPLVWNARLTEFCWQMAMHQHTIPGRVGRRTWAALPHAGDLVARVGAIYPRLPLPAWGWGDEGLEAIVHFGDRETILELDTLAPNLYVAAASDPALARARRSLAPLDPGWDD